MRRITIVAAALALCAGSTAYTQDYAPTEDAQEEDAKKLTIGDKAPPIDIAHCGSRVTRSTSLNPAKSTSWSSGRHGAALV